MKSNPRSVVWPDLVRIDPTSKEICRSEDEAQHPLLHNCKKLYRNVHTKALNKVKLNENLTENKSIQTIEGN